METVPLLCILRGEFVSPLLCVLCVLCGALFFPWGEDAGAPERVPVPRRFPLVSPRV